MTKLVAPIAERKPGQPALIDETGQTTWNELNLRSNRLISGLWGLGLEAARV